MSKNTNEEIEARYKRINYFKSELNNYRYYQYRVSELQLEMELVEYDQIGVKGISFEGISIENGPTQDERDMKKILLIQKKGEIQRKIDNTNRAIEKIDYVLSMLNEKYKLLIMKIYILKNTSYDSEVKNLNGFTRSTLQREVDREIYRCIKNLY